MTFRFITVLLFLIVVFPDVHAQCTGRYYSKDFQVDETRDVNYGSAVNMNGQTQQLDMHIFQPRNDTASRRPLIVLAFGGSFTAGFKDSPDIRTLCQEFASRGYVTATIDYRLNTGTVDSANMLKAVVRAVQDARAAIRFFYKDAKTSNTYRIDTNHIFMGGTSAGAFIGIHLGYITDTIGLDQWMKDIINSVGGMEGNSGNPGYSSRIHGIINLAGAIGDTAWMDPWEPPMVSMHGNRDGTVPYCSDIINVSGVDIIEVDGSATMALRAAHIGLFNPFYTWRGADHVPYVNPLPPPLSDGPLYMDTTVRFIRDFLFEILTGNNCGQALRDKGWVPNPCGTLIPTGINRQVAVTELKAYPNPSGDVIRIQPPATNKLYKMQVFDLKGRLILSREGLHPSRLLLRKAETGKGLFLVRLFTGTDKEIYRGKIFFN